MQTGPVPPMGTMPFWAEVTFHRGRFCEHSQDRQCNACFGDALAAYDAVVPSRTLISEYLLEHKVKDISLAESFSWLLDPP